MNQKGIVLKKVITEKIHGTQGMSSERHLDLVEYGTCFHEAIPFPAADFP